MKKTPMWKNLLSFIGTRHGNPFSFKYAVKHGLCTSKSSLRSLLRDLNCKGYIGSWVSEPNWQGPADNRLYHAALTENGRKFLDDEKFYEFLSRNNHNDAVDGVELAVNGKVVFSLSHDDAKKLLASLKNFIDIFKSGCKEQ